ncbi:MAG TPA: hypothetical protein VMV05_08065 [bacterium]|nr:hypothetical protein [bacterium]
MSRVKKLMESLGLESRKRILRNSDRRKNDRRYERVTDTKNSPDYLQRAKKDRRKGDRRK